MEKIAKMLIIACFSLTLACLCLQSSAQIDPKSIAGIWLFDEGRGDTAKDSSRNANDGKIMGPEWFDEGKIGSALKFDGSDDYVDCGNDQSLNLTDQITFVAWVSHPPGTEGYVIIKNTQDDVTRQWGFLDYTSSGTMSFFCNTGNGREELDWSGNIDDDKWHHMAFTVNNLDVELFIDGVSEGVKSLASKIDASDATTVWIGKRKPSNFPYTGLIDEVGIFSVVLSKDVINRVMNEGLARISSAVFSADKLATSWAGIKNQH